MDLRTDPADAGVGPYEQQRSSVLFPNVGDWSRLRLCAGSAVFVLTLGCVTTQEFLDTTLLRRIRESVIGDDQVMPDCMGRGGSPTPTTPPRVGR